MGLKPRPFSAFEGRQIRGVNSKTRVVLGIYTPWTSGEGGAVVFTNTKSKDRRHPDVR